MKGEGNRMKRLFPSSVASAERELIKWLHFKRDANADCKVQSPPCSLQKRLRGMKLLSNIWQKLTKTCTHFSSSLKGYKIQRELRRKKNPNNNLAMCKLKEEVPI